MTALITQGLSNKEIAGHLGISEATVHTHIYNLFQKWEHKAVWSYSISTTTELYNQLRSPHCIDNAVFPNGNIRAYRHHDLTDTLSERRRLP